MLVELVQDSRGEYLRDYSDSSVDVALQLAEVALVVPE